MKSLGQKDIREVLEYFPDSGIFVWRKARGRCSAGQIAGYDTGRGYRAMRVFGQCVYLHRAAYLYMTGTLPLEVDHINGNRADNRWENLRASCHAENSKNMQLPSTNKSGVMGVFWNAGKCRWTARIKVDQKSIHIGHFLRLKDATAARKAAESRYGFSKNHGRRPVTNEVPA